MISVSASSASLDKQTAFLGYSACALAGILWGLGFFFGKIILDEMPVESMVLYRFLFASVGMLPIALVSLLGKGRVRLSWQEWRTLLIGTALGIPIQFLVQFHGLALTTVSHASLMVGTMPVILALGAVLFAGERLDRVGWLALMASTCGAALIVLGGRRAAGGSHPTLAGDLLVVLSLVICLGWILINKRLMKSHPPLVVTSYGLLSGTGMLIAWIIVRCLLGVGKLPPVSGVSRAAWLALIGSGLLCTAMTTMLWNWGIHKVPASRAGVFLNFEPAIGSVLGVKLLGEHLGSFAWAGGALILASAMMLTLRQHGDGMEEIVE